MGPMNCVMTCVWYLVVMVTLDGLTVTNSPSVVGGGRRWCVGDYRHYGDYLL